MKEMIKKGTKHCQFCSNVINLEKDNFVLLGTYNRVSKSDDEAYFHFLCFVDYFNHAVLSKARTNVKFMQEKAMQLFNNPVMKSMLSQIAGSENVLRMLQTPLEENKTNFIKRVTAKEVAKKIQDVRKRKTKQRSKKMQ